jgi:hypothetical protein
MHTYTGYIHKHTYVRTYIHTLHYTHTYNTYNHYITHMHACMNIYTYMHTTYKHTYTHTNTHNFIFFFDLHSDNDICSALILSTFLSVLLSSDIMQGLLAFCMVGVSVSGNIQHMTSSTQNRNWHVPVNSNPS